MAKRKRKKESTIDLKPKNISKDHLEKVQTAVNNINRAQLELGIMETRKHNLLHSIANLNDELNVVRIELEKEYGTSDVDIQTGEIKYEKNEQTD
jgi:hypothetical protein